MMRIIFVAALLCGMAFLATDARAQNETRAGKHADPTLSAPQLVHEGNQMLLNDKANLALEKYDQAKTLAPNAREIAFARGLSHFKLGDYDLAREEFAKVAGSAGDALADDALYSQGTCDHAKALADSDNPQQAMAELESAMRTYRNVLARDPNHKQARDANFKAASMWRRLKKKMQQQEQQKKNDKNNKQNDDQQDQQNKDPQKQPSEDQEKDDQKQQDQQQKTPQDQQSQDQQSQDQQKEQKSDESRQEEKDKQQQQDQSQSDEQKQSQQQQAQQSQKERVSREQAERKLREMLQELKDRKKARQKPAQRVPAPQGGKDW